MADSVIAAIEKNHNIKFKEFQAAVYRKVLNEEDVFVSAPTGCGKTYCFAFMSEALDLQGPDKNSITLVVSALSSLLVQQTERLCQWNLKAGFLGELQTDAGAKQEIIMGNVDILLVTPETIFDSEWRKVLSSATYQKRIRAVIIDEAHCISHWYVKNRIKLR